MSAFVDQRILTIENATPGVRTWLEHEVLLPTLCEHSQNPAAGSVLKIRYQAQEKLLELFSLDRYVAAYYNHARVRDMEYFVQAVGLDIRQALGHGVELEAEIIYNAVAQRQRIVVTLD